MAVRPVVLQQEAGVTHYARHSYGANFGQSRQQPLTPGLVMSLCGFVRVWFGDPSAAAAYRKDMPSSSQDVREVVTVHLPGCKRCLRIAKQHPERVRTGEAV